MVLLLCGVHTYAKGIDIILMKPESKFWRISLLRNNEVVATYDTIINTARCTGDKIIAEQQPALHTYSKINKGKYTLRYTNIFGQHFDTAINLTCSNYIYTDRNLPTYQCLSEWSPGQFEKYDTSAPISSKIKQGDTLSIFAHYGGCFHYSAINYTMVFGDSLINIYSTKLSPVNERDNSFHLTSTFTRAIKYLADFEKSGIGVGKGGMYSTNSSWCYLLLNNKEYILMSDEGRFWDGLNQLFLDLRIRTI